MADCTYRFTDNGEEVVITGKADMKAFLAAGGLERLMNGESSRNAGGSAATIRVDGVERPTTNSNGRPIAQTEEGLRNFWRWFGDSKVVDADGRPMVVYHGTTADLKNFDPNKLGSATGAASAKTGFFFALSPLVASGYATLGRSREIANLEEFHASELKRFQSDQKKGVKWTPQQLSEYEQRFKKISAMKRAVELARLVAEIELEDAENKLSAAYLFGNEEERKHEYEQADDIEKDNIDAYQIAKRKLFSATVSDGANVGSFYLKIDNPVEKDYKGDTYRDVSYFQVSKGAKLSGNDGVILLNTHDMVRSEYDEKTNIFVAFSPTQIKSATGNSGEFSPDNPDIRYNVADDGEPAGITRIVGDSGRQYTPEQRKFFGNVGREVTQKGMVERTLEYLKTDFFKKLAVGIVDQFRGLRDLNDGGQAYMLARLSKGTAGAFETLLHHGKLSIKDGVYDGDQSGGFIERLGIPLHGELDDFLWYVAANRAEGLSKQERENLFTAEDIAAGKSLANGTTGFDYTIQTGPRKGKTTRNRAEIYADANRVFNEFQKNALDMAEQSGLIDGEIRKYWESEFYVPFYRVSEEDGEFIGKKMGNSLVRQQAFKKLKGGKDKLNSDLLSNTLLNLSHLIDASAKNRAAKASLEAAELAGVAHKAEPGDKNTVWFMDDGKKVEYVVDDPFVMTAITSLEYAGMRNGVMDVMTKFKHYLTIGVTASPAFKVRNLIRDSIQAIGTSDLGYNPAGNVAEGYSITDGKTAAKNFARSLVGMEQEKRKFSQEYVSALASGGLIRFGTMLEGKESDRARQLIKAGVKDSTILNSESKIRAFYDKYLEPFVNAYNELGNVSEEINRAALYNQMIKNGSSHAEAALAARDLMDFSMQGSFNTVRFLAQVVPFMNARLQGLYKLGRSAEDNPRKLAIVTGAVAMASIALMLGYDDDDDWKRREDWDRDNYWWFKLGGEEWRIPKPFEVGAVATLAERSLEYLLNDEMTGDRFRKIVGSLVSNNLSMNPAPQVFKPVLDLYSNKDSFTGRPIETMGMQRLDPTERYNSNTSLVARGLSNATLGALSPVQYDHVARAYFGWLGAFVVGGADMAARAVSDEPEKPTPDYWKFATQGMVREQGTGSSRYVTMIYEQAKELEQAHATYRRMLKDGRAEDAAAYAESHQDELKRYRQVEHVKRIESKFNEQIHAIERSDIDPDEKKARIDRINKLKESAAKRIAPGYGGP